MKEPLSPIEFLQQRWIVNYEQADSSIELADKRRIDLGGLLEDYALLREQHLKESLDKYFADFLTRQLQEGLKMLINPHRQ